MAVTRKHFEIVSKIEIAPHNTLVLVGAALNGPSFVPFTLFEESNPYEVLGACPLADAYLSARRAGVDYIVLYRINGSHAEAKIKCLEGTPQDVLYLRSVAASETYNNIHVIAYPNHLFVKNTDGTQRSYFYNKYPTAYDLAYAINLDAEYGLIEFTAQAIVPDFPMSNLTTTAMDVAFTGGSSDSNYVPDRSGSADMDWVSSLLKEKLKVALFGEDVLDQDERMPNSELGFLHFGVIALVDMFHDDDPEFTEMLGSFCLNKTKVNGFGCIGVIGTKPIYEEDGVSMKDAVSARVQEWLAHGPAVPAPEAMNYVQVVVGDTQLPESNGRVVSVAYAYAATQAAIPYYVMMTNKSIGIGSLRYTLGKEDVETLTAKGYICVVPSVRRGLVPYRATTFTSEKNSLLSKPHHIRISQFITYTISDGLDNLLGGNVRFLNLKDLTEWTKEVLDELVNEGVIRDYSFKYEPVSESELQLQLSFTPYSEIEAVYSVTTLSIPQGAII